MRAHFVAAGFPALFGAALEDLAHAAPLHTSVVVATFIAMSTAQKA